jgi:hypothetical protein
MVAFLGSWFMLLSFAEMLIFAIIGTCRSVVGTVGVVSTCSRWVLPRNVIRQVSTELDEVEGLLNRAEAINAILDESEYRREFTKYGNPCNMWDHLTDRYSIRNKFSHMRIASHRAPGVFQQLRLLFGSALTYKLYILSSQIGAIKLQLEVRRITFLIYPSTDGGRLSWRWTNNSCPRMSIWRAVSLQRSRVPQLVRV